MRLAAACTALLLCACASTAPRAAAPAHWASLPVLGALQVPILYHRLAETPLPADQLLAWYGDVCGEAAPEARATAAAARRPLLAKAEAEAARTTRWVVPLRQALGSYDAALGGFPTTIRTGGVVKFDPSDYCKQPLTYLVAFLNGDDYGVLKLPEAQAKRFVRANFGRTVVHELEVEVRRVQAGPPAPTVLVEIHRLRTKDAVSGLVLWDSGVDP
jgi:hypothetical protein